MPRQRRETTPLVHVRLYPMAGGRPRRDGRVRSGWYRNPDGVEELGLERQVGSVVSVFLRETSLHLHWCFSPSLRLRYSSGTVHRVVVAATRLRGRCFGAAVCRRCCGFGIFCAVAVAAAALALALVPLVLCS